MPGQRECFVVIGGSVLQHSLIAAARARGFAVCVVDGDDAAPGLALADVAVVQDFSELERLIVALEAAAVHPLAVASIGSDAGQIGVARVARRFGLPGPTPEMAFRSTNKEEMLRRFRGVGDVSARSRIASSTAEGRKAYAELGPRVIVKPCDSAGQRGTSEVSAADQVDVAIAHGLAYSKVGRVVVEEHVDGVEYAVSGWVIGGRYLPTNLTERRLYPPPAIGICIQHRYPSGLSAAEQARVHDAVGRAALSLDIEGVPTYAQVRVSSAGPRVFEIGPRLGGGKDAELCRLVHGIDQVEAVIDSALGQLTDGSLRVRTPPVDACGCTAFPVVAPGVIRALGPGTAGTVPGVRDLGFFWRPGQTLPPLTSSGGRLGYVQLTAPDLAELERRRVAAFAALEVDVER